MASSKTEICNIALDLLSAGSVVDIDVPSTAQDALLSRWYDKSRRKLLREHPWNFASKRALLAASSTAPAFGYSHQFPVPSDFLRLLQLMDADGYSISQQYYEFEDRNILYDSDDGSLRLRYIYDLQDVSKMDAMFIDLLAYEIALGVAFKITDGNKNVERIAALLEKRSPKAKAIDGQERPPVAIVRSRNIAARDNMYPTRTDRVQF